jgi:heme-degrading monooxygenase HmoA
MIARLWHGWTKRGDAGGYEELLRSEVLPGIHRVKGYHGAYLLRREAGEEVEFVTLTLFENLEAVVAFAGEKFENAVVPAAAQKLLARYDAKSVHYETILTPGS